MSTQLTTEVKNPTASALFYGYLGSHGRRLDAGDSYTQDGDLVEKLSNDSKAKRKLAALERDIDEGRLEIVSVVSMQNAETVLDDYTGVDSKQAVAGDMNLDPTAGSADGSDPSFLAGVMGNVLGTDLTDDANYVGGVIGHYSVEGTSPSTYPKGAVLAGVGDNTTTADGAVVAYLDGDSATVLADAAFKVMSNNSTAASGFDYGLDLQSAAHDGYLAVTSATYKKGQLRLTEDVVVLLNAGVPVDGVSGTGAGNAGPGSIVVDYTNADLYLNAGTLGSPVWKLVTRAA